MYVCMYEYMFVCVDGCMYVRLFGRLCVCVCVHLCVCIYMCECLRVCVLYALYTSLSIHT